jgi:hypothetical protein
MMVNMLKVYFEILVPIFKEAEIDWFEGVKYFSLPIY